MNFDPRQSARPTIYCLLSDEQRAEFSTAYGGLRRAGVDWVFETSPDDALERIGQLRPGLVFVGMMVGATEGLEFLAMLFQRYRDFTGRVVVLPNRDDPFPPVIQTRDPITGRSSTVQTDSAALAELIAAMTPESTAKRSLKATHIGLGAVSLDRPPSAPIPASPTVSVRQPPTDPLAKTALLVPAPTPPAPAPAPDPLAKTALIGSPEPAASVATPPVEPAPLAAEPSPPLPAPPAPRPRSAEPAPPVTHAHHALGWAAAAGLVLAAIAGSGWLLMRRLPAQAPAVTSRPTMASRSPGALAARAPAVAPSVQLPAPSMQAPESSAVAPVVEKAVRGEYLTLPLAFAKNGVEYSVTDEAELARMLARVRSALDSDLRLRLEVGGHASSDGPEARNEHLGYARAGKVVDYLGGQGVATYRIRVRSYGTSMPFEPGAADRNRRVTLRLVD